MQATPWHAKNRTVRSRQKLTGAKVSMLHWKQSAHCRRTFYGIVANVVWVGERNERPKVRETGAGNWMKSSYKTAVNLDYFHRGRCSDWALKIPLVWTWKQVENNLTFKMVFPVLNWFSTIYLRRKYWKHVRNKWWWFHIIANKT